MRDEGFGNQFLTVATAPRLLDRFNGSAVRESGYLQQSWAGFSGRLRLTGGARWDYQSIDKVAAVSPSGSAAWGLTRSTNLQVAWGQYTQYSPDLCVDVGAGQSRLAAAALQPHDRGNRAAYRRAHSHPGGIL